LNYENNFHTFTKYFTVTIPQFLFESNIVISEKPFQCEEFRAV